MRDSRNVFHLAVPCNDLDETYDYYVKKLDVNWQEDMMIGLR